MIEAMNASGKHGGKIRIGKRKIARPIVTNRLMHVVYRASGARGERSFLHPRHRRAISEILERTANEAQVHIVRYQNVGNHFHLLTKAKTRAGLQAFLRNFPSRVARLVARGKRGKPQGRFFDETVFTRIVEWGNDLQGMADYFFKNALESLGLPKAAAEAMRRKACSHPGNMIPHWVAVATNLYLRR
ncbi:MAG: hypothetical protein EOP11_11920 [Proteobacteria bacterium]|nr:MAG: hypothetical protein EOP11_11920 [Pseudomonadota bacterium]